jgi:hypothetical protein
MKLDIEALARGAGLEPRGSDFDSATGRWDEDTDLHIVGQDGISLPFLRAYTNAVLEAAALECEQVESNCANWEDGGDDGMVGASQCVSAVRAMKVTP